jgi:hypothetical protein
MQKLSLGYTENAVIEALDQYLKWLKPLSHQLVDKLGDNLSGLNWHDGSLEKIPQDGLMSALNNKNMPAVVLWKAVQKAGETLRAGESLSPTLVHTFIDYIVRNSAHRIIDLLKEIDLDFLSNMDMNEYNTNKEEAYKEGDFDIIILYECLGLAQSRLKDVLVGKGPERI